MDKAERNRRVTVCDRCLQASCWQGEFMCDGARGAGTTEKTVAELSKLSLEHRRYWQEGGDNGRG